MDDELSAGRREWQQLEAELSARLAAEEQARITAEQTVVRLEDEASVSLERLQAVESQLEIVDAQATALQRIETQSQRYQAGLTDANAAVAELETELALQRQRVAELDELLKADKSQGRLVMLLQLKCHFNCDNPQGISLMFVIN